MKERDEFDDYVKGLFNEDPKVPSEFSWENMDIELPSTAKPEEEKDKRKYLLLTLLLAAAFIFGVYFGSENSPAEEQTHLSDKTTEIAEGENVTTVSPFEPVNTEVKSQGKESAQKTIQTGTSTLSSSQVLPVVPDSKEILKTTLVEEVKKDVLNVVSTRGDDKREDEYAGVFNESKEEINQEKTVNGKIQDADTDRVILSNFSAVPVKDFSSVISITEQALTNFASVRIKETGGKKNQKPELRLAYGYNTFRLSFNESDVLNNKVESALGNSFALGLRLPVKGGLFLNLAAGLDRYHSTFNHSRDLEPELDFDRGVKIFREEITFHNNFTNTLSVQVGLLQKLVVSKRFEVLGGLALAPTYILSAEGKTTSGVDIEQLSLPADNSRFVWGGNLQLSFAYRLSSNLSAELVYRHGRFLSEGIFINTDTFAKQQNSLSLGLAYRLRK